MATLSDQFPFGDLDDDVVAVAAQRFPGLPAAEVGAGFALAKAIVAVLEGMTGILAEADLTPARWRLLMALVAQAPPEGATIGELAGHLQVREPTVTGTVDRLEREDLVRRTRSEADRRVVTVSLTPAGAAVVAELLPRIAGRTAGFVTALGGPREARTLASRLVTAAEHALEGS